MKKNKRPNLFIVGAPKCGTSSLHYHLSKHPEIYMSRYKEPHFFGKDLTRLNKIFYTNEKEYLSLFNIVKEEKIIGESSPQYLYSYSAPREIKEFNPESKIIILLRNPINMIYSYHSQLLYSGNEIINEFEIALKMEQERKSGFNIPGNLDMLEKLFYKTYVKKLPKQICRYYDIFSKDKVKIIFLSDIKNNFHLTYKSILQFLNVDMSFESIELVKNKNKVYKSKFIRDFIKVFSPKLGSIRRKFFTNSIGIMNFIEKKNTLNVDRVPMDESLKAKLDIEFFPIIKELEDITNRDLSNWYG